MSKFDPESHPNQYEMPTDQFQAELNLVDFYKESPMAPVLAAYLNDLKRFAGISIPNYTFIEPLSDTDEADIPDEFVNDLGSGVVDFDSTRDSYQSVRMPVKPATPLIEKRHYDQLSPMQKDIYRSTYNGDAAVGEALPVETQAMLHAIFGLIGAEKVRDDADRPADAPTSSQGSRIYKGRYMDSDIYIGEHWATFTFQGEGNYITRSIFMHGAEAGEAETDALTIAQLTELGQENITLRQIVDDDIDRTNYSDYIELVRDVNTPAPIELAQLPPRRRKAVEFLRNILRKHA
jgi:hypothetical protein